jgi:hypothetical protein
MVDSVKDARSRNVLKSFSQIEYFTQDAIVLNDGLELNVDAVIFCTGFKPSLKHLSNLQVINADGKSDTTGTKSKKMDGLWFVGYGSWTGFASATLIGVGRSAKTTVDEITKYMSSIKAFHAS